MKIREKILIIDDERTIRNLITTVLTAHGYVVVTAATGAEAYSMISSHCPDVILLDLGLPDMDGMKILQDIRSWSSTPVIIVSARTMERDKIAALDMGADDYIEKPFGTNELVARVRAATRHTRTAVTNAEIAQQGTFTTGDLVVNYTDHSVKLNHTDVHFTPQEFKIIALLAKHAGKILTYDTITREIWGPYTSQRNQILRVHMANIRRKIEKNPVEPEYIFTEIGVGFRMRAPDE